MTIDAFRGTIFGMPINDLTTFPIATSAGVKMMRVVDIQDVTDPTLLRVIKDYWEVELMSERCAEASWNRDFEDICGLALELTRKQLRKISTQ